MGFLSLFAATDPSTLLLYSYDANIVALSVTIAMIGGIFTLYMLEAAQSVNSPALALLSRGVASLTLGASVWSMHYTGMLALNLCTSVNYHTGITAASIIPAMLAGWIATYWLGNHHKHVAHLFFGGTIIGAGIGLMHYTGMEAMQMDALLRFDVWGFSISIFVAICLSFLSIYSCRWLQNFSWGWTRWLIGGSILGLAVSAMHYTGMQAARISGIPQAETPFPVQDLGHHLTIVILSTLFLLTLSFVGHVTIRVRSVLIFVEN